MKKILKVVGVVMIMFAITTSVAKAQEITCSAGYTKTPCPHIDFIKTESSVTTGDDDIGLFSVRFKITAVGGDIYIPAYGNNIEYAVDTANVHTPPSVSSVYLVDNTDTELTKSLNFKIEDGDTETFTFYVSVMPSQTDQYRLNMKGVIWDVKDVVSNMTGKLLIDKLEGNTKNNYRTNYLILRSSQNPDKNNITQTPTPIGSVPVSVKSSDVVLKVNSNRLTMLYSHGANEDLLAGVVSFSINGGKNGINIYEYPGISVIDSKGVRVSPQSTQSSLSAVGNVQKIKDDQGRSLFVIPAGKTVFFESKIAMSPLEMFSGIYYVSLEYIYGNTNTDRSNAVYVSIPKNKSSTVTVVGEKSPYIASVTNPVNVGEKLSINGVRLLNKKFASVYIDGVISTAANSTLDGSKDGTVLWFVVPSLKNGYHTLFVKDSINGQSNRVSFEVGGGLMTPEITSVVPSKGPVGTQVAVKGTQLKSKVNNLVSLCSQNSCGNYTGYTSEDGGKVSFTVPNIPSGVYNLSIIDLVENNSSTNSLPFTVIQPTPTSTPPVTAATSSLVVAMKSSDSGNITSNKGDTILLATVSFDSKNNPVLLQSFNFDVVVSGGKSAGDIFSNIMVASPAGKTQLTPSLHMTYNNMNLLVQPGKSNVAYITATLNSGIPNGTKAYVRINSNMENVKAIDSKSNPVPVEPIKMLSSGITTFTSPVVNTSTILNALLSVFGL